MNSAIQLFLFWGWLLANWMGNQSLYSQVEQSHSNSHYSAQVTTLGRLSLGEDSKVARANEFLNAIDSGTCARIAFLPIPSSLDDEISDRIGASITNVIENGTSNLSVNSAHWSKLSNDSIVWLRNQARNVKNSLQLRIAIALVLDNAVRDSIERTDRLAALMLLMDFEQIRRQVDQVHESKFYEIREHLAKIQELALLQHYCNLRMRLRSVLSVRRRLKRYQPEALQKVPVFVIDRTSL